ncbi:unnamed protein product [Brachionus calyciflorus]|uniref:Diacylglycerol kinase n=1 Tax=Brachionus calyciflorus TaxID=104777 RepID=A0A814ADL3_9BILA|nr:unnamed protein product [Brachionus calyciflorus]
MEIKNCEPSRNNDSKSMKKTPLRLSKSLNLNSNPYKLTQNIKELSHNALLSSIPLFNNPTAKISRSQSSSFTSINNNNKTINDSDLMTTNNKESNESSQVSQQVGSTSELAELTLPQSKQTNLSSLTNIVNSKSNDQLDLEDFILDDKTSEQSSDKLENNFKNEKKKYKRFALGWVGKTVGKRTFKKSHTHHVHNVIHRRKSRSPSTHEEIQQQQQQRHATTSVLLKSKSIRVGSKKSHGIDWSENAKQGVHLWSDLINQTNESCYLSEQDALDFHCLTCNDKCQSQSKNVSKKKCNLCKIIVHETCIDTLQKHVKCRQTFREATNKKKSFKDKEQNASILHSNVNNVNSHHWLCRKYDDEKFDNKCQACLKSYTNRFGLQTSRSIVSCSWCKVSYHFKCFSLNKTQCNFGEFNQLIVPPNWIIKSNHKNSFRSSFLRTHQHRSSKRHHQETTIINSNESNNNLLVPPSTSTPSRHSHSHSSFIIRPTQCLNGQNIMIKPLLVLINPKSGGKQGPKLLKKFTWLLNPRQVFDLTLPGCPKLPLHLYRNVPNLRILVGGGDGTVGWVLSVIDQIKFLASPPSIAVLPLGTGNDLARALNWGGGYTDEPLTKILNKVLESRTTRLDRWQINTKPNMDVDTNEFDKEENVISKLKNDVMNNYFSLGADAHVCLEFHERREANPHKFSSRWFNLLHYAEAGGKDIIKKTWRDLKDFIKLECDGKNYTDVIRSRGYHCLIFLNIPKYSSGTNPWGSSSDNNYQPQAMNDGRLEVIGCFTATLAKFQLGGNGERICQAQHIKLTTSTCIPIQIDGEPAKLCPSVIEITHKNQALMLEHVKYNTDSPVFGYQPSIHKNFEVRCVLMEDFENFRGDNEILQKKAIYLGTIRTSNLTDSLSKVRNTISFLLTNCANGFYTSKWTFLSGEEFYRISDDSDECLLDLVSTDEIIYILDENPRYTNKSLILKEINVNEEKVLTTTSQKNNSAITKLAQITSTSLKNV